PASAPCHWGRWTVGLPAEKCSHPTRSPWPDTSHDRAPRVVPHGAVGARRATARRSARPPPAREPLRGNSRPGTVKPDRRRALVDDSLLVLVPGESVASRRESRARNGRRRGTLSL